MRAISYVIVFIILHSSFIISEAQRSKEIYIQVIDTAGLTASVVADTSWILGQLDIVRAELADTSEAIQSIIDQQRRLYFAPYYLGQDTLGGIIYHLELDANGEVHGLIAAKNIEYDTFASFPYPTMIPAFGFDTLSTNEYTMTINDGQLNTSSLITDSDNTAAIYCDTLTLNGFSDWYLPSLLELRLLALNLRHILQDPNIINWFDRTTAPTYLYDRKFFTSTVDWTIVRVYGLGLLTLMIDEYMPPTLNNDYHVIPIRKF